MCLTKYCGDLSDEWTNSKMVCNHMTWEEIQSATWEKNQNPKILYTPGPKCIAPYWNVLSKK